jgi:hypothetical protein
VVPLLSLSLAHQRCASRPKGAGIGALCAPLVSSMLVSSTKYFIFHISYFIFRREAAARGIAAEPPKRMRAMRTSGAHPKCAKVMERIARRERAHKCRRHAVEVSEAARPNHYYFVVVILNKKRRTKLRRYESGFLTTATFTR